MYFSKKLSDWISDEKINRTEVINRLKNSDIDDLKTIDLTTLSRWISGKTTPTIKKQLAVGFILNADMATFIKGIEVDDIEETVKDTQFLDSFDYLIDNTHLSLGYAINYGKLSIVFKTMDNIAHRDLLDDFLINLKPYIELREIADNLKIKAYFNTFTLKDKYNLKGHISFLDNVSDYTKVLGVSNDYRNHFGINPIHFIKSQHFYLLWSVFLCYIINKEYNLTKKKALLLIRTKQAYNFFHTLCDAKLLRVFQKKNEKLMLIEIDLLLLLSKPRILKGVQKKLNTDI